MIETDTVQRITVAHGGRIYSEWPIDDLIAAGVPHGDVLAAAGPRIVAAALAAIDAISAAAYTGTVARAAVYRAKEDEARRYVAAGRPADPAIGDYPILVAEASARGVAESVLADMIIAAADTSYALLGAAEAARIHVETAVSVATTVHGAQSAADTAVHELRLAVAAAGGD